MVAHATEAQPIKPTLAATLSMPLSARLELSNK